MTQPIISCDTNHPQYTQPWGLLVKGLTPICAQTLTLTHLWICKAFGFIAINQLFELTPYVISIRDLGVCHLNKKEHVIQAVRNTIMTNLDFSSFFHNLAFSKENILSIINNINVIPRGYSTLSHKSYENHAAKIHTQDGDLGSLHPSSFQIPQ